MNNQSTNKNYSSFSFQTPSRVQTASPDSSCDGLTGDDVITADGDLHGDSLRLSSPGANQDIMATTIHTCQKEGVGRLVGVNLVRTLTRLHTHEVDDLTNSVWWREKERGGEKRREREKERECEREAVTTYS